MAIWQRECNFKRNLPLAEIIMKFLLPLTLLHLFVFVCQVRLLLELYRLQGNMTRVKINELKPLKPRFEVPDVLIKEPNTEP